MGALPKPDVAPGPRRDLSDALHELHHRAGWPSLRVLAREAGCSHTTVSAVFSSPRLPSWGVLELLVEAMDGDPEEFRSQWLAAGAATDGTGLVRATPRLAGRRDELATVRGHLESGVGLLLVTGVAGMGKTRLVSSAAESVEVFVATGSCLPLSTEVPLLPVADALRTVYESDDGEWIRQALEDSPPYVMSALSRLLPELAKEGGSDAEGTVELLHVFSAVAALLTRLARRRALVVQIEDLHWADSATLDLLEQLVVRPRAPRLLGTWRVEDPTTPEAKQDWFARIRRCGAGVVELPALTIEETAEQLRLLTGTEPDAAHVAAIYARSAGQPLFTEHLATQSDDGDLPSLLVDLLDRRLGRLTGPSWQVARALGFADRGLRDDVLRQSTVLSQDELTTALHELRDRRLVASVRSGEVQLSHPLLAEAVRRRAMPGEAADQHRRLAAALASSTDVVAAEVAAHWEATGDDAAELQWRIRAARESAQRLDPTLEAEHWVRALELWPEDGSLHGAPALDRTKASFLAMDALLTYDQVERTDAVVASMLPQLDALSSRDAAELSVIAGVCEVALRSVEKGLALMERGVDILESLGPSTDLVLALRIHADGLVDLGRLDEAAAFHDRAWEVNQLVGDVQQKRALMAERAWHLFEAGHRGEAVDTARAAALIQTPVPDPFGDVNLAKHCADLLKESDAPAADVVAAARRGLAIADECAIETGEVGWLRFDISTALATSGDVGGAAELIDPLTDGRFATTRHQVELARTDLDIRRGRLDEARDRVERAQSRLAPSIDIRSKWCGLRAQVELWTGRPSRALETVGALLDELVVMDEVVYAAPYFLLIARASGDATDIQHSDSAVRRRRARRLHDMRAHAVRDPLANDPGHSATWLAELERIAGTAKVGHWAKAATEWDGLSHPHDAAYCRWRAAQLALAAGQGSVAARLLRRAATDAGEHVLLRQVIEETRA